MSLDADNRSSYSGRRSERRDGFLKGDADADANAAQEKGPPPDREAGLIVVV
jgi:hypothetical protein